jgi:radical SAM superfamily enzyme YgiQ (UPF0313 family)
MSRKLIDRARRRLAAETGSSPCAWGGRLSVALIYPNTYHHAMSNLGFLAVYQLINSRPDALCERFFLPDAEDLAEHRKTGYPLFSLESGRHLDDFDVIAFSVSFENDYLHLPTIFELGRLPLWGAERNETHPLVLCGGVCAFLNPEPLATMMDLFAVGEAEALLPALLQKLNDQGGSTRAELLKELAQLPGIYVPALYRPEYCPDGTVRTYHAAAGAPPRVARRWLQDLDSTESRSFVLTPDTEFGDMYLSEISRGCSRGCRFCAAGYIYQPPRERSLPRLLEQVEEGLCQRPRIGLVGAAVTDHPDLAALGREILARGGEVSLSSLRLDALDDEQVAMLRASKHRTIALAPEAGSQRLRDLINKGFDEEQILAAVKKLSEGGIPNLKLYFLIGLPTETAEDIEEILALTARIRGVWLEAGRQRGALGRLLLSVNPFIPKPFTPLQWAPMATEKALQEKVRRLRAGISRLANTELAVEPLRAALLQAFLARGDRRQAAVLPELAAGSNLNAACRRAGLDPAFYSTRERSAEEVFPWEVLDSGVSRAHLWREYQRALVGQLSPRCQPDCCRCGVCH